MKPIHKFNNGRGATICRKCSVIISEGMTKDLYCERCKCIEDTLDMKETTKCYCGHTTTCDCGPEEHVELINSNIEEFDKALELSKQELCSCTDECLGYLTKTCKNISEPKQETVEEYYLPLIKNMLEYTNDALAMRFMEKYYHAKKEQEGSYSEKQMDDAYDKGFKDAIERRYSEEEVLGFGKFCLNKVADFLNGKSDEEDGKEYSIEELFEQFKKK